jgi:2-dehydropantoate 2-reductase
LIVRIAIMGSGGIGGYYGARAQQLGHDVAFIARGAHLEAMRHSGLVVLSPFGDARLATVTASDAPAQIGPVDLVVFAVKMYDTESAARAMTPLVGSHTRILTLQNGIDSVEMLTRAHPSATIVAGATYLSSFIAEPGVIQNRGGLKRVIIGHASDPVVRAFADSLNGAPGVEAVLVEDASSEIWEKFVTLTAFSAATALMRAPIGAILACEETRIFLEELRLEGEALARAMGHPIAEGFGERVMARWRNLPPDTRASTAHDLAHGKRLELDWLSGTVHRLGLAHQVPTPCHSAAYRGLYLYRNGATSDG